MIERQQREELIAFSREPDPLATCISVEQGAEGNEEQVHEDEHRAEPVDILLRFGKRFTAQVLLHHVLIEARHNNGDKGAAEELLEEIILFMPVPEKDLRIRAVFNCLYHFAETQVQFA